MKIAKKIVLGMRGGTKPDGRRSMGGLFIAIGR